MDKLSDKQIELAVNWWAERIANPEFKHVTQDELKQDPTQGFAMVMGGMLKKPVAQSVFEKFKESLEMQLRKYNPSYIGVDYGPDSILWSAGEEAGVPKDNYPWKTSMVLRDGKVEASQGYGTPFTELN